MANVLASKDPRLLFCPGRRRAAEGSIQRRVAMQQKNPRFLRRLKCEVSILGKIDSRCIS